MLQLKYNTTKGKRKDKNLFQLDFEDSISGKYKIEEI